MNRVAPILLASSLIASAALTPALAEPAAPAPVPSHKHLAGVKYEDLAKSDAAQVIEVQSISWGTVKDAGTVYSADPMEGGQVTARKYAPGRPTFGNATFDSPSVAAESKPKISEIPITKQMDSSSPKLMAEQPAEPGKLEYPNAVGAGVAAKTSATFTTLAGKCVKGKHLDKVTIVARTGSYTLHDAIVTDVTPAGDGMETVSVSFASRDQ